MALFRVSNTKRSEDILDYCKNQVLNNEYTPLTGYDNRINVTNGGYIVDPNNSKKIIIYVEATWEYINLFGQLNNFSSVMILNGIPKVASSSDSGQISPVNVPNSVVLYNARNDTFVPITFASSLTGISIIMYCPNASDRFNLGDKLYIYGYYYKA